MDATRMVIKYGDRCVVEISEGGKVIKYAAVTDYNPEKPVGSQWNWGHYYDIWGGVTQEEALRLAVLDLYNIEDGLKDELKEKKEQYDRIKEIAEEVIKTCVDEDDKDTINYLKNVAGITEKEAKILDVYDLLYPKFYKVVEVTLTREQRVTISVAMPEDEDTDDYTIENHIHFYDLEDEDELDNDDWEIVRTNEINRGLSAEDVEIGYYVHNSSELGD